MSAGKGEVRNERDLKNAISSPLRRGSIRPRSVRLLVLAPMARKTGSHRGRANLSEGGPYSDICAVRSRHMGPVENQRPAPLNLRCRVRCWHGKAPSNLPTDLWVRGDGPFIQSDCGGAVMDIRSPMH